MKVLALAAMCGLATLAGCQVSGEAEVDTTNRPAARAEVDTTGTGYSTSYTATRDTQWAASTEPSAARGTLRAGDRVMFNGAADTSMEWQQARTVDGRVVYVRPADFRAVSR